MFQGDSGAPYWVYHMGRAVIIGVHSGMTVAQNEIGKHRCGSKSNGAYVPFLFLFNSNL